MVPLSGVGNWMNLWINQWINEWANERTSSWMNEWLIDLINEWKSMCLVLWKLQCLYYSTFEACFKWMDRWDFFQCISWSWNYSCKKINFKEILLNTLRLLFLYIMHCFDIVVIVVVAFMVSVCSFCCSCFCCICCGLKCSIMFLSKRCWFTLYIR